MNTKPTLTCRQLHNHDWSTAESIGFQQAWLPSPQPELRPTTVRTAWRDDALLVQAELSDADIFNPVTGFNSMFYEKGDVFEIFLRPTTQDAYSEIHIGPDNQKLQLRFPRAGILGTRPIQEFLISNPVIVSRVELLPAQNLWKVSAEIPFALVQEAGPVRPGTQWLFSFSRYDYTRGQVQPVLSSSSPHQKLNYHRQEEWGTLTFA
ncbi:MAG: carbohydrate-binding family 9-like protein [Verrucomicrobiota bacterium]